MAKLSTCFSLCCFLFILVPILAHSRQPSGDEEQAVLLRQQEADRVTNLPGQPAVNFRHYAGYVKLQPQDQKALFYWFFEAQSGVARKPLVLWLNGGPGCSSVAYGAAQELGPFLVRSNGTELTFNKFSWNKVANMLFLEAPVGVGFSYTNNSEDLRKLGDQITAADSYTFLINWFKRFPSFKSHDFYIAGESYAGHYVPQLAQFIYEKNKGFSKDSYINLKGFMIGNAAINEPTDTLGLFDYAWSHAIISDQLYDKINKECSFKEISNQTAQCTEHMRGFMEAYSDIDMYSIYTPVCLKSSGRTYSKLVVAPRLLTQHGLWHKLPSGYDPCTEDYVEKYFNRKDVQTALHANVTKLPYPYTTCSGVIKGWNDSPDSVLPTIQKLLDAGLRIWIYSGDTDGRVPVTSTRYSINKMRLKIKEEWRAWFYKSQVAGWVETYEGGLTFATVRGAGHQVPVFAPDQSLSLFTHFLTADTLPPSRS
ncbi:serine carboxypeptidase-like 35 isoform X1 [Durio zibethinus]|uniref:Carboxypeptidase n=1 Tax=Durio zibethinus TaxID=66656 RepID=A0A6P5XBS6_DURZI|nr:serine carboxypeptidase-like 35 isoform X1 [Durio zibethinus]